MKNESQIIHEEFAKQISRLMNTPDKAILLPSEIEANRHIDTQMDESRSIVRNVQGSSAGAGSGEFHVYRALRRKEQSRIKSMEAKSIECEERREFEEKRSIAIAKFEEKTKRRRDKRLKRKMRSPKRKNTRSAVTEERKAPDALVTGTETDYAF